MYIIQTWFCHNPKHLCGQFHYYIYIVLYMVSMMKLDLFKWGYSKAFYKVVVFLSYSRCTLYMLFVQIYNLFLVLQFISFLYIFSALVKC